MLTATVADVPASTHRCRAGCGRGIQQGEVVLHLKLGSSFPYDCRHHYFHAACVGHVMEQAEDLVPDALKWFEETRARIIETGQFLVDA